MAFFLQQDHLEENPIQAAGSRAAGTSTYDVGTQESR
jgi:hypothetical protein